MVCGVAEKVFSSLVLLLSSPFAQNLLPDLRDPVSVKACEESERNSAPQAVFFSFRQMSKKWPTKIQKPYP